MPSRFTQPIMQALDSAGVAVGNRASLEFFKQGTTTRLSTFQDAALTIPNSNPVFTGKGGRFPTIILQDLDYTVVFRIDGTVIWSEDVSGTTIPQASTLQAGIVELATTDEMLDGTSDSRVPTVSVVTAGIRIAANQVTSGVFTTDRLPAASEAARGVAEIATQSEADTGTDTTRFITPVTLAGVLGDFWSTSDINFSNTENGFIVLPTGLIVQWGKEISMSVDETRNVDMPTAFQSSFFVGFATARQLPNQGASVGAEPGPTLSQITLHNGLDQSTSVSWLAIGI